MFEPPRSPLMQSRNSGQDRTLPSRADQFLALSRIPGVSDSMNESFHASTLSRKFDQIQSHFQNSTELLKTHNESVSSMSVPKTEYTVYFKLPEEAELIPVPMPINSTVGDARKLFAKLGDGPPHEFRERATHGITNGNIQKKREVFFLIFKFDRREFQLFQNTLQFQEYNIETLGFQARQVLPQEALLRSAAHSSWLDCRLFGW